MCYVYLLKITLVTKLNDRLVKLCEIRRNWFLYIGSLDGGRKWLGLYKHCIMCTSMMKKSDTVELLEKSVKIDDQRRNWTLQIGPRAIQIFRAKTNYWILGLMNFPYHAGKTYRPIPNFPLHSFSCKFIYDQNIMSKLRWKYILLRIWLHAWIFIIILQIIDLCTQCLNHEFIVNV